MIICSIPFGPLAICTANALYGVIALIINTRHNKKVFDYTLREQLKDIVGYIALSSIMAIIVFFIGRIQINIYLLLIIQVLAGGAIYYILSRIFHVELLQTLTDSAKKYLKNLKQKKETVK